MARDQTTDRDFNLTENFERFCSPSPSFTATVRSSREDLESIPGLSWVNYINRLEDPTLVGDQLENDWILENLKKRECISFIPCSNNPSKCKCGKDKHWHTDLPSLLGDLTDGQPQPDISLDQPLQTETASTDAFGRLQFESLHKPSAPYVRLDAFSTKPEDVIHLLTNYWGLQLPKLLISVTGGAQDFQMTESLKSSFSKGLIKSATSTEAWITTGGTNTGVMKLVGQAVHDYYRKSFKKIPTIGIATWGIVANNNQLKAKGQTIVYSLKKKDNHLSLLDKNHTNFLLVDDGTTGIYGGEIKFRSILENYISHRAVIDGDTNNAIPVVCICLEGGVNTIYTIRVCLESRPPVPVVVVEGSGRAADVLAYAIRNSNENGELVTKHLQRVKEDIRKFGSNSEEEVEEVFKNIEACTALKSKVIIHSLSKEEDFSLQDLDLAILNALVKGSSSPPELKLDLALIWNRIDMAKIVLKEENVSNEVLEKVFEKALIQDNVEFIQLMLQNDLILLNQFLTAKKLVELYNQCAKCDTTYSSLANLFHAATGKEAPTDHLVLSSSKSQKYEMKDPKSLYSLDDIGSVFNYLVDHSNKLSPYKYNNWINNKGKASSVFNARFDLFPKEIELDDPEDLINNFHVRVIFPYHELLIWAVIMKRHNIANFVWKHGEEALAKILVASLMYKNMIKFAKHGNYEKGVATDLEKQFKKFQLLAINILDHCYKMDELNNTSFSRKLILREMVTWNHWTCIELAAASGNQKFIAHTLCQTLISDIWMGHIAVYYKLDSLIISLAQIFPPLLFTLKFRPKNISTPTFSSHYVSSPFIPPGTPHLYHRWHPQGTNSLHRVEKKTKITFLKKVYYFYSAPVSAFWANAISFIAFLVLFSYVITSKLKQTIPIAEWILVSYIIVLAIEETRQILMQSSKNFSQKIFNWAKDRWNILDATAILLFVCAFVMRNFKSTLYPAQTIYALDLVLWFLRILDIYSVDQKLGPYVTMILKMLFETVLFLLILLVFITSYGIASVAVLQTHTEPSWQILKDVFYIPYWQVHGELFLDEHMPECVQNDAICSYSLEWVVPVLMAIYLIVANVLLLNLLIAIFNNTFNSVHEHSSEIWKYQRYRLVTEFSERPVLIPPLMILGHLWLAISRIIYGKRKFWRKRRSKIQETVVGESLRRCLEFEEECVENFIREENKIRHHAVHERTKALSRRVEELTHSVDDIRKTQLNIQEDYKKHSTTMEERMMTLEQKFGEVLEKINLLTVSDKNSTET